MKKVKFEENLKNETESFFADNFFTENDFENQQLSVFQNETALEKTAQNEIFLDNLLSLIKLIFLYVPGAMTIHFVGTFVYFYILFGLTFRDVVFEFFAGMSIAGIVGTFLTMFGIGKMSDLNYLKVPASILAASVLLSIIFSLITIFTGVEITGTFFLLSFPITIICGYVVKKILDKE